MGNGMCSRKQKRIFQTLLLLTVVFGFLYGAMLYLELQTQLRKAEAVALKYQQHQDSLSAQLQVVYEHRSRLEKSLQKERLEHKKAKEDFLVYKLEAQETLNKGRQDSNSRYSALNVQHQMLKSQHEELRKQHSDLEEEHRKQGEDFSRTFNDHKQRYLQLQQEKEQELSKLKETVYNLREENRQLRKAHQDIHTQLQDVKQQHKNLLSEHEQLVVTLEDHKSALAAAQTQVAEYKQLKDTLNRIPSFRNPDPAEQQNVTFTHGTHSTQGHSVREKLTGELQEVEHLTKAATNFRSPYEEQLEQQRLAARRDEEAQRLREHQEALHQQRLQGQLLRQQQQQQFLAREMAQQKQTDQEDGQQQHQEQLRQQAHYNAVENDIAQGAEDQGIPEEEGGAYERDNQRQDEAEGDPGNRQELNEPGHQEGDPEAEADRAAVEDINPADDPNNQGEDEFEEAEQEREENLPEESEEQKQREAKQGNVEMDEHLVMAGNPDQQEDNVDEQYQEEGEEEVQEDLTEEKKRELEHNAEETYGENPDDKNNDVEEQGVHNGAHPKGRHEHYEEEEDEEDGAAEKPHRRAEM
ncbi:Golgi integral membrane protein 4 isoform X5 [Apodemus sylvaticus]|uniref:Golgi integral membrane protein 4 isoform X5 n=1 Tax=Apodemus sylvaticus TaxID=10129 RepID=UPI002243FB14|nr:Golgi integral membrane protein 4 isoform X5 [Apodemus sylvaticus]